MLQCSLLCFNGLSGSETARRICAATMFENAFVDAPISVRRRMVFPVNLEIVEPMTFVIDDIWPPGGRMRASRVSLVSPD